MRAIMLVSVCTAVLVIVADGCALAVPPDGIFVSFGGGFASRNSFAASGVVTYKHRCLSVSARFFATKEFQLSLFSTQPDVEASDVALMVGITSKYTHNLSATAEVGLARTTLVGPFLHYVRSSPSGHRGWEEEWGTRVVVGLALQSQIYWRRVGITIMANRNGERSFAGVMLSFRLGRCN